MNETACQFGAHGRLAGIVTEPETGGGRAGCILVSAGLVPKFGPYRLYALLARQLANLGLTVLRFDLGSIGDSGAGQANLPLPARTEGDIAAAVDYLASRYALDDITLCGLCSGAEDSFRYAEKDPRVRGVAMIDPFRYVTTGVGWRLLLFRLMRRALGILRIYRPLVFSTIVGPAPAGDGGALIQYRYMEHAESSRILQALIARRVRAHFIYTGGMRETFNHPGQLAKMFPDIDFHGCVTLSHLPAMEHTQILAEDREKVIEAIVGWFTTSRAKS